MDNKILVQKANIQVQVSPQDKNYYLSLGYSVIDKDTGKIIEEGDISDTATLKQRIREQAKKISELEETISNLSSELTKRRTRKNIE